MITTGFMTPLIPSLGGEVAANSTFLGNTSSLTRQIRSASAAFLVAAGSSCDVSTLPINIPIAAAAESVTVTSMACSPPRSHTRIINHTRTLVVPTAALASKTSRKKRSGGGGDGGNDDFGGDDGFFGGGDDGFGGGGGDDGGEGSADDSMGRWLQDVILLWTVFCAWSTYNVLGHVTKTKQPPTPCLAAVSFSASASTVLASS